AHLLHLRPRRVVALRRVGERLLGGLVRADQVQHLAAEPLHPPASLRLRVFQLAGLGRVALPDQPCDADRDQRDDQDGHDRAHENHSPSPTVTLGNAGGAARVPIGSPAVAESKPIECWMTDMDGVLVHEGRIIPGADEFIARLRETGKPFLVLTNNSIYTPRDLQFRLRTSGIDVPVESIWTSALATATFLHGQRPQGSALL